MIDQLIQMKLFELLKGLGPQQAAAPTVSAQDYAAPQQPQDLGALLQSVLAQTGGKGMDDDVPATIEGQIPAALSEGEHVIPADVVSMLGDGNTNAGNKVLENLINSVRVAKTGTKDQADPLLTSLMKQRKS